MAFANVGNLTGGSGDDDFILSAGVAVTGHLDGGGGMHNTLDYSHYSTAVSVNLASGAATNVFAGAAGGATNFSIVLGGSANDTLTGGAGGIVLVGNGGNDKLTGGGGRNVLVGGLGADTLTGGPGEDFLASGKTSFDGNLAVLETLFDYWSGGDDFATRASALKAGSIAGVPAIDATTIFDDKAANSLTGGAGLDWFFAKLAGVPRDAITDLDQASGEQIN